MTEEQGAIVLQSESGLALLAEAAADRHPAAVYLASLGSEKSRAGQRSALDAIVRILGGPTATVESFPWASIRYTHAMALRAKLVESFAPATVNKALCALRGVVREAMRLGLMSAEDCARVCDVKSVRGSREPAGRALEPRELASLFSACDGSTPQGARDAAILALLYGAGLRRAEVAALTVDRCDVNTGAVRVVGKGNKERLVYATNGSLEALRAWLSVRGMESGALFVAIDKRGRLGSEHVDDRTVARAVERAAQRAGVADVTPHDMRRSMISDLLDAGADIATVQRLAGHAAVTTTQRYDRRGERTKMRAAEMLRVPFSPRSS